MPSSSWLEDDAGMLSLSSTAVSSPLNDAPPPSSPLCYRHGSTYTARHAHPPHHTAPPLGQPQTLVSILCPSLDTSAPTAMAEAHSHSRGSSVLGCCAKEICELSQPPRSSANGSVGQFHVGEELLPMEDLSIWSGALPGDCDGAAPLTYIPPRRLASTNSWHRKSSARSATTTRTIVHGDGGTSQYSLSTGGAGRTSSFRRPEDNPLATSHSRPHTNASTLQSSVVSVGCNTTITTTTNNSSYNSGGEPSYVAPRPDVNGRDLSTQSIPQFMSISRLEAELRREADDEELIACSSSGMSSFSAQRAREEVSAPTSPTSPAPLNVGRTVMPQWRTAGGPRPMRRPSSRRARIMTNELTQAREQMKELGLVQFNPACSTQDCHRSGEPSRPLSIASPARSLSDLMLHAAPNYAPDSSQGTAFHSVLSSFV